MSKTGRSTATKLLLALGVAMMLAPVGNAMAAVGKPPHPSTGTVKHARGTTAELTGAIAPNGNAVNYFFQYGTTLAYGSQTPMVVIASPTAKIKVGQIVSGLKPSATYHYRLVVVVPSSGKIVNGRDRTFVAGKSGGRLVFKLTRPGAPDVFGNPFVLTGTLSGTGSANHAIRLQASPFPYLEPFANIGLPGVTNAAGAFAFRVTNMLLGTQFRVMTVDPLPVFSPILTEHVAVKVTLRVSHSKVPGLVRLYGTVTPAHTGTRVLLQLEKTTRPKENTKSESTTKQVTIVSTRVKRAAASFSRFSVVLAVHHTGRYRAFVQLTRGPLVSGASSAILLHAPRSKHGKKR
jgi:hypothetical protein